MMGTELTRGGRWAVMRGSFLVNSLGPGIKSSRVSNPLSNGRSFEINNRKSFLSLRKKEKNDVRPTVYRPIASSGMGFTEKGWHDEDGETISTRMQMKATRNNENFRRNERNNGDSPHLRGKLDVFCATGDL
jgi:hypothetical protein